VRVGEFGDALRVGHTAQRDPCAGPNAITISVEAGSERSSSPERASGSSTPSSSPPAETPIAAVTASPSSPPRCSGPRAAAVRIVLTRGRDGE
jgi:hypothetical protein